MFSFGRRKSGWTLPIVGISRYFTSWGEKGSGEGRGEEACRVGGARGVHNGCGLTSTMFTRSTEVIYTLHPLTSTTTANDNRDRIYGYDIIHAAYGISNNLDRSLS